MYAALDLGQRTIRAVLKRQDGKIVNELKIKKQADTVLRFLKGTDANVVMESAYNYQYLYDLLKSKGYNVKNSTISVNACHPIVKGYYNPSSIFCYSDTDLEDFLNDIYDKKMSVYDPLSKSRFREIRQSGRFDDLKDITLEHLTRQKITKIYHDLKKSMLPMSKKNMLKIMRKRRKL
jgi:wobble nucleotide-excising tRNase